METEDDENQEDSIYDVTGNHSNSLRRSSLPPCATMIDIRVKYRILQRWSSKDDSDMILETSPTTHVTSPVAMETASLSPSDILRKSSYNPRDYISDYRLVCSSGEDGDVVGDLMDLRGSLSPVSPTAFYRRQSVFDPSRFCVCVTSW